jgi:hypothetical protein
MKRATRCRLGRSRHEKSAASSKNGTRHNPPGTYLIYLITAAHLRHLCSIAVAIASAMAVEARMSLAMSTTASRWATSRSMGSSIKGFFLSRDGAWAQCLMLGPILPLQFSSVFVARSGHIRSAPLINPVHRRTSYSFGPGCDALIRLRILAPFCKYAT